jgi:hypothetical protein
MQRRPVLGHKERSARSTETSTRMRVPGHELGSRLSTWVTMSPFVDQ